MVRTILLPSTLGDYFGISGTERYLKEKGLVAETMVPGNSLFEYEGSINRRVIAENDACNMVPHSNAAYPATIAKLGNSGMPGKIAYIEASDSKESFCEKIEMFAINTLAKLSPTCAGKLVNDNLKDQLKSMVYKGITEEKFQQLMGPLVEIVKTNGGLYLVKASNDEWNYVHALDSKGMKLGNMIEELAKQGTEILFINGADSVFQDKRRLPGKKKNINMVEVPKAGHLVHAEQPDYVNAALSEFLS